MKLFSNLCPKPLIFIENFQDFFLQPLGRDNHFNLKIVFTFKIPFLIQQVAKFLCLLLGDCQAKTLKPTEHHRTMIRFLHLQVSQLIIVILLPCVYIVLVTFRSTFLFITESIEHRQPKVFLSLCDLLIKLISRFPRNCLPEKKNNEAFIFSLFTQ